MKNSFVLCFCPELGTCTTRNCTNNSQVIRPKIIEPNFYYLYDNLASVCRIVPSKPTLRLTA